MYILKFVLRSWWRNKLFVTISLVSLIIGIACTNLLTAFVLYEYNIEYNNPNRDRILRLTQTLPFAQQEMQGTFVYHESVPEIISQFPEIEASLRTQAITHTKIRVGDQEYSELNLLSADSTLPKFIPIETLAGKIEEKIPVFTALKLMVQNRYFLISLGLMLFYTVYQIILGIDLTYYCQYVMNDVNLVMPLSMAEKIPMIFIILLLPKLIPKYGKRNLIVSGCILGIVGQVMFLFNDTSVPLAIVSSVIRGIGMSPFYGVQYSLPSDAIEYGQWKTGKRIEGLMFSSMSFGQKFGAGITNAVLGAVLSMVGYNGMAKTAAQQAPAAISVIKFTYLYVPIIVWVVMMLITMCYKLDKTYKQMMAELSVRELSGKL